MKEFKISFNFEADDDWSEADVKEMVDTVIDPIYHLGDSLVRDLNVKEIKVEKWTKKILIDYTN